MFVEGCCKNLSILMKIVFSKGCLEIAKNGALCFAHFEDSMGPTRGESIETLTQKIADLRAENRELKRKLGI